MATRRHLSKAELRSAIAEYRESPSDEAFERMFERDKQELRDLGIPLQTGSDDGLFNDDPGYRIDPGDYALPEVRFRPEELAVLGLAAQAWQQAALGGPASEALRKLGVGADSTDPGSLGVEPRVATDEAAFGPVYAAVLVKAAIAFDYRTPRDAGVARRHLQPWGVVSRNGRWYVLGFDTDRMDSRVFRLSRIVGDVVREGPEGAFTVPEGVDPAAAFAGLEADAAPRDAVIRLRPGRGQSLRRRASSIKPGADWDEVTVSFRDEGSLAAHVVAHGPDAVVMSPDDVRSSVMRILQGVIEGNPQ